MTARATVFAIALSLSLALAAPACAPSVPRLVAERRYADAICLAKTREDAQATLAALEHDLAVRVLVQRAPAASWTALLGDARGEKAAGELVALRTVWIANTVSAKSVTGRFVLRVPMAYGSEKDRLEGREYSVRANVARHIGEKPPKQEHHEWTEHLPRVAPRDPLGVILSLFLPDPTVHHESVTDPDRKAWLAEAPRTTALWDALEHGQNAQGFVFEAKDAPAVSLSFVIDVNDQRYEGGSCDATFWFDLPATGDAAWRNPRELAVSRRALVRNDDAFVPVP